jgi:hypothetical protein
MKQMKYLTTICFCINLLSCNIKENQLGKNGHDDLTIIKLPYSVNVIGQVRKSLSPPDTSKTELLLRFKDFKSATTLKINPLNIKVIDKEKNEYLSTSFCVYPSNEISLQNIGGMFTVTTVISSGGYQTRYYNFADSIGIDILANSQSNIYLGLCFDVIPQKIEMLYWIDNKINVDSAHLNIFESDYIIENFK